MCVPVLTLKVIGVWFKVLPESRSLSLPKETGSCMSELLPQTFAEVWPSCSRESFVKRKITAVCPDSPSWR